MPGIRSERTGSVGTIVIDNPERRNAMNAAMYAAVPDAVRTLLAEDDLRTVILRGEGTEAFGAGSDISEFPAMRMGDAAMAYDDVEHAAWDALASIPVPVIASIHGPCMGGGIAMALHCDVRVAADDATFSVPPARLGLSYPEGAIDRLVALVGPGNAKLLLFTAEVIDASAALRIGLVDRVVPKADLDDDVEKTTARIGRLAPLSHVATKRSIDSVSLGASAEDAAAARAACYASSDFREGVQAFLEKRHAQFTGK